MTDRRFIEESFPVREVGEISANEKNIRTGNISTLHVWWARRPLAASRATAYAALTPIPKDVEEWQKKRDFIIELCKWENSNNQQLLDKAHKEIIEANNGVSPKVLDPFAGGGSFPLEALRLGCESFAGDYNPIAILIEKSTLEYPEKFGRAFENMPEWSLPESRSNRKAIRETTEKQINYLDDQPFDSPIHNINPLLNGFRYWSKWVLTEANKVLKEFYPQESNGNMQLGYIWARTLPCQNPVCRKEIPLFRQYWIVNKDKKKVALFPEVRKNNLSFKLVGDGYEEWPVDFNPDEGSVSRAVVTCQVCGSVIDEHTTRKLFRENKSGEKLVVVVSSKDRKKYYRLSDVDDIEVFTRAKNFLENDLDEKRIEWGMEPVPDEEIPLMSGVFNVPIYGIDKWGSLFNSRQKLALITFIQQIRKSYLKMLETKVDDDFAKAIVTYLALSLNRLATRSSNVSVWHRGTEGIEKIFALQALPMQWEYAESNVLTMDTVAGFWENIESISEVIKSLSEITLPGKVEQASATQLNFPDNFFEIVLTDPPYYNSVPYADLSDFFYVILKRSIGFIFPDLFSTPLSPKEKEITEMAGWDPIRYPNKDKKFFEENLKNAFFEIYRVLKPNGIAIIVYAHKSTEGWETVINALIDCGLIITGAWPINTEMKSRLRASESAALASSIYIIARKIKRKPTGFFNDIKVELHDHLNKKLQRLWEEGIGGADFFIAAIGSAIEVFGQYEQVIDYEGNIVRADRLLQEVRTIATDYAVRQILHNGFASEISDLSRLYVLWRWNYGEAAVPFDEARKLGQSCGIDISLMWGNNSVIKKQQEFIKLLGPQNRRLEELDDPRDLIDVLHKSLLLWEKGNKVEMIRTLTEKSFGKSEAFYRVAQAISETLPLESKEKKLLDGFLAGKERYQSEVEKVETQGRLFDS